MKSYGYVFEGFVNQVVDVDNSKDPMKKKIEAAADKEGLTVKFNKMGSGMDGACVMPPEGQVTISLMKDGDNKWRVMPSMFTAM